MSGERMFGLNTSITYSSSEKTLGMAMSECNEMAGNKCKNILGLSSVAVRICELPTFSDMNRGERRSAVRISGESMKASKKVGVSTFACRMNGDNTSAKKN